MNVTIREIEAPMFTSFVLMQKIDTEALKQKKKIVVTTSIHTKTRVSTDIQFKDACRKINIELPGYKFDVEDNMNYFTGSYNQSYYSKKSKKQEKAAYLSYLKELIPHVMKNYLHIDLDEITVEFVDSAFRN